MNSRRVMSTLCFYLFSICYTYSLVQWGVSPHGALPLQGNILPRCAGSTILALSCRPIRCTLKFQLLSLYLWHHLLGKVAEFFAKGALPSVFQQWVGDKFLLFCDRFAGYRVGYWGAEVVAHARNVGERTVRVWGDY